jgi:adenylylsulfate kinase-like enzyme
MLSSAVAASSASNGSAVLNKNHAPPKYHHIWLVTGPAGCGKSTVAEYLANALGIPYIEGDKVSTPPRSHMTESHGTYTTRRAAGVVVVVLVLTTACSSTPSPTSTR